MVQNGERQQDCRHPVITFFYPFPEDYQMIGSGVSRKQILKTLWPKRRTPAAWVLQTYLALRDCGFPCTISTEIPAQGICVACRGNISYWHRPNRSQLLICILGDGGPHPFAQMQIVQNREQQAYVPGGVYIPQWPQYDLIPRIKERQDMFRVIGYMGDPENLAREMQGGDWRRALQEMGLEWRIPELASIHDYSEIDAVVLIRDFKGNRHRNKPAAKLINAWLAGIPAIGGRESSIRAERKSELDYLEVTTLEELLASIDRLKNDTRLRHAMIANGHSRSQEFTRHANIKRWVAVLSQQGEGVLGDWQKKSFLSRNAFFLRRYLWVRWCGISRRLGIPLLFE